MMYRYNQSRSSMLPVAVWVGLVALCVAVSIPASAQGAASMVPPGIRAAYNRMNLDLAQRDADGVLRYYTADATFEDISGRVHNIDHVEDNIRAVIRRSQSIAAATTIDSALVRDSGVTVTVTTKFSVTHINPTTNYLSTTLLTLHQRDHWVRVDGHWRINRERTLAASGQTDGSTE